MSARGKRGQPPRPVIRAGTLGYTPLNALSASYLVAGYGDTVIGFRDPDLRGDRPPAILSVREGSQLREMPLAGLAFNGYTDAFYRGRLPEVILAFPPMAALNDFLTHFAEYLDQLLSLGFFVPKKEIIRTDPVTDLAPCFILAGSGLLYSRLMTGLVRYLNELKAPYPFLDASMQKRILGQFVRGLPAEESSSGRGRKSSLPLGWEDADCQSRSLAEVTGQPFSWLEPIRRIRIAGGSQAVQKRIESVLKAHGLIVSIENRTENPVERMEFENAWRRLSGVILPTLAQRDGWSSEQLDQWTHRAQRGIVAIGRLRQAFGSTESMDHPVVRAAAGKYASSPIRPEDRAILTDLDQYALMLGLNEAQTIFQELATRL